MGPEEPITIQQLATFLDVTLLTPGDIPRLPPEALKQLLTTDPAGWSAVGCKTVSGYLVIYNPNRSPGRISNDCAHEMGHILLEHESSKLVIAQDGRFVMRSYDDKQEKEADWLAAALLLPRDALIHIRTSGLTLQEAAKMYMTSKRLIQYRVGVTGVDIQLRRRDGRGRRKKPQ